MKTRLCTLALAFVAIAPLEAQVTFDRVLNAEFTYRVLPHVSTRVGGLYDQISIAQAGPAATKSYGTRHESRAYIGLVAKFGKVSLAGIEGIELDPEPYDVWFVHDKGFLQLQAVF